MTEPRNIAIIAGSVLPLLDALIHAFEHEESVNVKVLTRDNSLGITNGESHEHEHEHEHHHTNGTHPSNDHHHHHQNITQIPLPDLDPDTLKEHLAAANVVISLDIKTATTLPPILEQLKHLVLFLPPPTTFPVSNNTVADLLPGYKAHQSLHEELTRRDLPWRSLTTGVVLEEGLAEGKCLSVDLLWSSVVTFSDPERLVLPISTYTSISHSLFYLSRTCTRTRTRTNTSLNSCLANPPFNALILAIETATGKQLDRYEGSIEGARKEASERVKHGFLDGAVGLWEKVCVWDHGVGAWEGEWDVVGERGWEEEAERVVRVVKAGGGSGGGCGC